MKPSGPGLLFVGRFLIVKTMLFFLSVFFFLLFFLFRIGAGILVFYANSESYNGFPLYTHTNLPF